MTEILLDCIKANQILYTGKYQKEFSIASALARKAGKSILDYKFPSSVELKKDNSLKCYVDEEISSMIFSELKNNFPEYGILDEEKERDERDERFEHEYCWVVDPLDGTIDYLRSGNDFGVMIGLMHKFAPVLGVVYQPKKDRLVYAVKDEGAYLTEGEKEKHIHVSDSEKADVLISHFRNPESLDKMIEKINPDSVKMMSTSFKILEVALGNSSLFLCPKESIMYLWDFCALEIILNEAGGRMTNLQNEKIDYSQKETVNKKGLIVSNGVIHNEVYKKIKDVII